MMGAMAKHLVMILVVAVACIGDVAEAFSTVSSLGLRQPKGVGVWSRVRSSSGAQSPMYMTSIDRRGFVENAALGAAAAGLLIGLPGGAAAGTKKLDDKGAVSAVVASSPAQALDMIIAMKAVKAFRELGPKVENGDIKAVKGWITNGWNSASGAFLRKNKVLESLSRSQKGTAAGADLESDPAFFNEASPESNKVDDMTSAFYVKLDALQKACDSKDAQALAQGYAAAVEALDGVLKELSLPLTAEADPKLIKTP